jgi:ribosomal protein S12 methylthiotransferase accessory factor
MRTYEATAERLIAALVSRRSGLIREIAAQGRGPEEPCPPHLWTATLAHYDFRGAPHSERLNAGKGGTEAEAKLSALGEATERYSAYHWDPRRVRVGIAQPGAITPIDSVLYSAKQYADGLPYPQWSPDTETSWIEGVDLTTGASVEVPAALTYLVSPTPRREDHVTAITSNGLAAGADLTHAIIGGLQELIERDALMITWLNRLPATLIKTPERGCMAASIIRHYARYGVVVRLLLLATDQAPIVVMAIADNPDPRDAVRVIGMGCDLVPAVAVDKAVFELCQARPSMAARMRTANPAGRLMRYEDVRDLDDHPLFHAMPEHAAEFEFLFASGAAISLDDFAIPPQRTSDQILQCIVDGAAQTGVRSVYVDITSPDIASLGPRVVRCFAPGLQPIHFGYGEGRFGAQRLFDAPVAWGLRDAPLDEVDLNPCPHPMA